VPRKPIDIEPRIEYLSLLNERGEMDDALDPKLDGDTLVKMYRHMLATRRLDERMINLQRQGRIGTYGPSRGQEACQIGTAMALNPDDWTAQSFRELGMMLVRGWGMHMPMFFWGGFEEGNVVPEGVNDLPLCVPVASQLLHGVGLAWAMKIKKKNTLCLTYTGDGGTSEGDFHEAMNFAGVFNLPLVTIVQNNHFAISVPRCNQCRATTLAQKALAYGFDGIQVDGNDVLAVYVATRDAAAKARSGGGPTLIECVTYRLSVHTTADDPTKYRSEEEVKQWEKRDPLIRFEKYLKDRRVVDDKALAGIEEDIKDEIRSAVEKYEAYEGGDELDPFKYILSELPPELVAQKEEFAAQLKAEGLIGARKQSHQKSGKKER
jgi:pyruvate dehydrogenase E1 component alpha subunit